MSHLQILQVILLLTVLHMTIAGYGAKTDGMSACGGGGGGGDTAFALDVQLETVNCKSCHGEQCPHWNFALKRTKEQLEAYK
jgi:hypothetical protein